MPITLHDRARVQQDSGERHSELSTSTAGPRRYYRPRPEHRNPRAHTPATRRGDSWWPAPPEADELGPIDAVWLSPEAWLAALDEHLHRLAAGTGSVPELEGGKATVRVATILDVAAVEAATADRRTGRHVTTAHATVARRVGCSYATVRRVRAIIARVGFAVTEERGRYLSTAERERAQEVHGYKQIRMASTRALVMPRPAVREREAQPTKENEQLPRRGPEAPYVQSVDNHLTRASARKATKKKTPQATKRPSLPIQRLAGHLAARLPQLAPAIRPGQTHHTGHIGRLCHVLSSVGIDPELWTARDLYEALNRRNAEDHRDALPFGDQRDPLALLAHQLRDVLARTPEAPGTIRQREAEQRGTEKAQNAATAARKEAEKATATAAAQHAAAARAASRPAATAYRQQYTRTHRLPTVQVAAA